MLYWSIKSLYSNVKFLLESNKGISIVIIGCKYVHCLTISVTIISNYNLIVTVMCLKTLYKHFTLCVGAKIMPRLITR